MSFSRLQIKALGATAPENGARTAMAKEICKKSVV